MQRYGVPYMGSKSGIAAKIVAVLPPADTFVDLFAGGCAITHAAMLSGKYRHIITNDLGDAPDLFRRAIEGEFHDERRWITRAEFFERKDADPYIRYGWSFGFKGDTYLYHRDKEAYFHALSNAYLCNDYTLLEEIRPKEAAILRKALEGLSDRTERRNAAKHALGGIKGPYEHAVRQERLQALEGLRPYGLPTITQKDYREVEIPDGAVVYADPPYDGTAAYIGAEGFDGSAFRDWARRTPHAVFVSEYTMPADFDVIAAWPKRDILSGSANIARIEKLYKAPGK